MVLHGIVELVSLRRHAIISGEIGCRSVCLAGAGCGTQRSGHSVAVSDTRGYSNYSTPW